MESWEKAVLVIILAAIAILGFTQMSQPPIYPSTGAGDVACASNTTLGAGAWTLASNCVLNDTGGGYGFLLSTSSSSLDCQGHSLVGDNSSNSVGVKMTTGSGIVIKNCNISGFDIGTYFFSGAGNTLANSTIYVSRSNYADPTYSAALLFAAGSSANTVNNVTATSVYGVGAMLYSAGATVINNSNLTALTQRGWWCYAANSGNTLANTYLKGIGGCAAFSCSGSTLNNVTVDYDINSGGAITLGAGSNFNTIKNSRNLGQGQVLVSTGGNYNTINGNTFTSTCVTCYSVRLQTIASFNNLSNNVFNAKYYPAFAMYDVANNNTMVNNTFNGNDTLTYGSVRVYGNSTNNIFINNTFNGMGGQYALSFWSNKPAGGDAQGDTERNNTFISNVFANGSTSLVYINNNSSGNLFYWNTFASTSGYYVYDTNGNNYLNNSQSGNIYPNVLDGTAKVYGNVSALYGYGYYRGFRGAVPYNSTTSLGKMVNATDYVPLTKDYATFISNCANISSSGTYVLQNNISANISTQACILIGANDVTLDCVGYTLTSTANTTSNLNKGIATYGNNTVIKNCIMRGFVNGIEWNAQADMSTSPVGYVYNGTLLNSSYDSLVLNSADWKGYDSFRCIRCSNVTVRNNNVTAGATGYFTFQANNFYLYDSIATSIGSLSGQSQAVSLAQTNDSLTRNNTLIGTNVSGATQGWLISYAKNITSINDTMIAPTPVRIVYNSSYITVTGAYIRSTAANSIYGNAIYLQNNNDLLNTSIFGNIIINNSTIIASNFSGILAPLEVNLTVTGNTITGNVSVYTGAANSALRGGTIAGNTMTSLGIYNGATYGSLVGSMNNTLIANNTMKSVNHGIWILLGSGNNIFLNNSVNITVNGAYADVRIEGDKNNYFDCQGATLIGGGTSTFNIDMRGTTANTTFIGCNMSNAGNSVYVAAANYPRDALFYNNSFTVLTTGSLFYLNAGVNNFTIDGANNSNAFPATLPTYGYVYMGGSNGTIQNWNLNNKAGVGRILFFDGKNNTIKNNVFNTTQASTYGIRDNNKGNQYFNNIVQSTLYSLYYSGATNSIARNNWFYSSNLAGGTVLYDLGTANMTLDKNTIIDMGNGEGYYAVTIGATAFNVTVSSNNITAAAMDGIGTTVTNLGNHTLSGNYINTGYTTVELYSNNTLFANNTLAGSVTARNALRVFSTGNTIVNNIFTQSSGTTQVVVSNVNNTFYWNNFSSTGTIYVQDNNGSNFYNTTIAGKGEGNFWFGSNVTNINMTIPSSRTGWLIGINGSFVPYNNTTSSGKVVGAVFDYAPLLPSFWASDGQNFTIAFLIPLNGTLMYSLNFENASCNISTPIAATVGTQNLTAILAPNGLLFNEIGTGDYPEQTVLDYFSVSALPKIYNRTYGIAFMTNCSGNCSGSTAQFTVNTTKRMKALYSGWNSSVCANSLQVSYAGIYGGMTGLVNISAT